VIVYDKWDWHDGAALERGQPPEYGFTHIGFFLAWLIRHDLIDPSVIGEAHVEALKAGRLRPNDLADLVDGVVGSFEMRVEGVRFANAYYPRYMDDYQAAFSDLEDYAVPDAPEFEERAATLIDAAYAQWVADGRPDAPTPDEAFEAVSEAWVGTDSRVEVNLADGSGPWDEARSPEIGALNAHLPHHAPDLEAAIRAVVDGALELSSVTVDGWGSTGLKGAFRRLGLDPKTGAVAIGMADGSDWLSVTLYRVPGASKDALEAEFPLVIPEGPGRPWRQEHAGSVDIYRSEFVEQHGPPHALAWFALDGVVGHIVAVAEPAIVPISEQLAAKLQSLD
jgi:hypothetical protein